MLEGERNLSNYVYGQPAAEVVLFFLYLMLKGSMDKNILMSICFIFGMSFCAKLSVSSDFLDIFEILFREWRESMCPFNKSSTTVASTWIRFSMKHSNRAKYKKVVFCLVYYQGCFRKFCRKTSIDVPFATKSSIEKMHNLKKIVDTLQ